MRVILFIVAIILSVNAIGIIFWNEEIRYRFPTPVPENLRAVPAGQKIDLQNVAEIKSDKPVFLHFYNPKCACSRFNAEEFRTLVKKFRDNVEFIAVIQSEDKEDAVKFKEKYELNIPVISDIKGEISDICGIYTTPQAVLLDKESKIYYKGNYNKARFCNSRETKFAEKAIQHFIAGQPLPAFRAEATIPYGCSLPSDETMPQQLNLLKY